MNTEEYSIIRSEYNSFDENQTEFHDLDHDFLPDANYTCIDVLQHNEKFMHTLKIVEKYHKNVHQCYFATINTSQEQRHS